MLAHRNATLFKEAAVIVLAYVLLAAYILVSHSVNIMNADGE